MRDALSEVNDSQSSLFDGFSAQDIAISFYGYWYRLYDMQLLRAKGKRVSGGMTSRLELANLHWQLVNQALDDLVRHDPVRARAVQTWLTVSSMPIILSKAKEMDRALRTLRH